MTRSFIRVKKLKPLNDQNLTFSLSYSSNLRRYFHSNKIIFDYPQSVNELPDSIQYVPAIANLMCTSWAVGADLYVEELDQTYYEALQKIKTVFQKWYPKLPFTTEIHVNKLVENHFPVQGTSLLFSGGVDSIVSYFKHKHEKPQLIMVWCDYYPPLNENVRKKIQKDYRSFAAQEGVELKEITANTRQFINERLLGAEKGRFITDFLFWAGFRHMISFTGTCAPITANHSKTIYVASSYTKDFAYPWGSHPKIDNKLAFADTKVQHDSYDMSRQDKLRYLKPYLTGDEAAVPLNVCSKQKNDVNCGRCEKCLRTIMGLMNENIDPENCGFILPDDLLAYMKKMVPFFAQGKDQIFMWTDIQKHIPDPLPEDYKYKEFLEWLKTLDFLATERSRNKDILKYCILQIYYRFFLAHQTRLDQIIPFRKKVFKMLNSFT